MCKTQNNSEINGETLDRVCRQINNSIQDEPITSSFSVYDAQKVATQGAIQKAFYVS